MMKLLAQAFWILPLVGLSSMAAADTSTPKATLSAFRNEAELQSFLAGMRAEQEKECALRPFAGKARPGSIVQLEAPGRKSETIAGADGRYSFSGLDPGSYRLTADGVVRDITINPRNSPGACVMRFVGGFERRELLEPTVLGPPDGSDDGGIVRRIGDYFIVLRQGWLYSIRATAGELKVAAVTSASADDSSSRDPKYDQHDQIFVNGRMVLVTSSKSDAVQVGLFHLDERGLITHRASYQLAADEGWARPNYVARLVGDTLYFLTPLGGQDWQRGARLPGLRRLIAGDKPPVFERTLDARNAYQSGIAASDLEQVLHALTRCDIAAEELRCRSTAVFAPRADIYRLSQDAAYAWISKGISQLPDESSKESVLLRMPLDGSAPTMLSMRGSLVDEALFVEREGYLNALLRSLPEGQPGGSLDLLHVPLTEFGGADTWARGDRYRHFPSEEHEEMRSWATGRFVGNWLLFGSGLGEVDINAVRVDRNDPPTILTLEHGLDRVDIRGRHAIAVGYRWFDEEQPLPDTMISTLELGKTIRIVAQHEAADVQLAESQLFHSKDPGTTSLIGLPVQPEILDDPEPFVDKSYVGFFREGKEVIKEVGVLSRSPGREFDYSCDRCTELQESALPIFSEGRTYALIGYELVEGEMIDGKVRERWRIDLRSSSPTKN